MIKRYKKLVYKDENGKISEVNAEKDTFFKTKEGEKGELIIETVSYRGNMEKYTTPPVPVGYMHVEGKWYNGFVIRRISDNSEFVWVPVGFLDPDGTLDGKTFDKKFGRRLYQLSPKQDKSITFEEEMSEELKMQVQSINKYGGFYYSRYSISMDEECRDKYSGEYITARSVKGVEPYYPHNPELAKEIAAILENREEVKSHLVYGAEYDCILAWLIKQETITIADVTKKLGLRIPEYHEFLRLPWWGLGRKFQTGQNKEGCFNNICDLVQGILEWTQERARYGVYHNVVRGVDFSYRGIGMHSVPLIDEDCDYSATTRFGFRAALWIE